MKALQALRLIVIWCLIMLLVLLADTATLSPAESHALGTAAATRPAPTLVALRMAETTVSAAQPRIAVPVPPALGIYRYGIPRADYLVWLDRVRYDNRTFSKLEIQRVYHKTIRRHLR